MYQKMSLKFWKKSEKPCKNESPETYLYDVSYFYKEYRGDDCKDYCMKRGSVYVESSHRICGELESILRQIETYHLKRGEEVFDVAITVLKLCEPFIKLVTTPEES